MVKQNTEDMNGSGYEWEYAKKIDNRSTGQKISNFLYNPENNSILGRTPNSWGGILLFYAVFYSVLGAFFAVCMKLLLMSLTDDSPKWQLAESLIGTTPGLGFRPMANDSEAGSVIWINSVNKDSWIKTMKKFQEKHYKLPHESDLASTCLYKQGKPESPDDTSFCLVDFESFGDCSASKGYGLNNTGSACVFIKLNRIYGWIPEYYNKTAELPHGIPLHTRDTILKIINDTGESNQVWLSCDGQSAHDRDNQGEIKYWPGPGFPYYFYPFSSKKHYMSPLVAVQFVKPKTGVLINIECRAWAHNIKYQSSSQLREGSVHFELMIDE